MEGMIVKTGLQDATKNVRIYGTISAASNPQPPAWITHPLPPCASPCLASSRNPLFPRFFFTSSCRRFPECAARHGGRSYFSCFSLLLSLRGVTPPRVFPCLTSPSPFPFLSMSFTLPYLQSRSLPQTTSPHYREQPTRRREFPPLLRRHFNVTLIKSNNQYLPRKKF